MERRSYHSREVEKLELLLDKLLLLKEEGLDEEFRSAAETGYAEFFGSDFSTFSLPALEHHILGLGDVKQLECLAEILELDRETLPHTADERALRNQVLNVTIDEIDRLYAAQGTFSLTNRMRKR